MEGKFYTSTEAAQITNCSRRQLQYWREKGVVVPTVNASGKGRNVYYSKADLLALTIMEYLLSIGLNFEKCHIALEILREKESWLFDESATGSKMKRLMFLPMETHEEPLKVAEFENQAALEVLYQGQTVIPFWCDHIYERLQRNISIFSKTTS